MNGAKAAVETVALLAPVASVVQPPKNSVPALDIQDGIEPRALYCSIATYVLIAIVKKELQLNASLYTCLQILSVSVFEKTLISCALQPDDHQIQPTPSANQLILFGF